MSNLAELERKKRRRLQEDYADLRPSGRKDDDRQAKLRNLLLGASADAGLPPGLQPVPARAAICRSDAASPRGVPVLAAVAAAAIAGVESTLKPKRGGASGSISGAGRRRDLDGAAATGAARAPPPGPSDGGFLPEVDPVKRLSGMQFPPGVPMTAAAGAAGPAAAAAAVPPLRGGVATAGGFHAAATGDGVRAASSPALRYATYGGGDDGYDDNDDDDDAAVELPSDVELALIAVKSDLRSHPPSADLPPMALRCQLSCLLSDRSTVERQLDEQRRANRVRVFKLPTGTDEFGVLATSDYRAIVHQAADTTASAAAAAAAAADTGGASSRGGPSPSVSHGAYGTAAATGGRSRWHAAAEAFLSRVIDRCTEFQLSRDHLLHLLQTPPPPSAPSTQQQQQQQRRRQAALQQRQLQPDGARAVAAIASAPPPGGPLEDLEEQVSLLLHLGCLARHTDGDADAFVLAIPGAGKLVKAVLGGRRELLTWLSKRQNQEAPEEQISKLKLRGSCLPPLYHVRDLVGRGAAKRLDSTCGPVIKLPRGAKKQTDATGVARVPQRRAAV